MTSYLVAWEIDVEAKDEVEAAKEAKEIMQDKSSEALYFSVKSHRKTVWVDLFEDVQFIYEKKETI